MIDTLISHIRHIWEIQTKLKQMDAIWAIAFLVIVLGISPASALAGYTGNLPITFNNADTALTNYPVKFTVYRSAGSSSGSSIYVGVAGCDATYKDIRFTKDDETTELDYWIESYTSSSAIVWCEFDSIPVGYSTFYFAYGNAAALDASSGDDTFTCFDHFTGASLDTTTRWTIVSGLGTPTQSGSILNITDNLVTSKSTFDPNATGYGHSYRTNVSYNYVEDLAAYFVQNGFYKSSPSPPELAFHSINHDTDKNNKWVTYNGSYDIQNVSGVVANTWHIMEISVNITAVKFYVNDTLNSTHTSQRPDGAMPLWLRAGNSGTKMPTIWSDWVLVRKYANNEPSKGYFESDFSADDTTPIEGQLVTFTDSSSGTPISWWWDFDNDGVVDSNIQNDIFIYSTAGSYTVNLTILTTDGYATEIKTNYITVSAGPATPTPTVGGGLHFSGAVTPVPTTNTSQYYDEMMAGNLTLYEIGVIVPEPLVDALGGGESGWGLAWLIVFGVCFLILFGRQKNVFIPLIVFLVVSFFIMQYVISEELRWIAYAFATAAMVGVIFYLARRR